MNKVMGGLGLLALIATTAAACTSASNESFGENLGETQAALTEEASILGFEKLNDWSVYAGSASLSLSTHHVEGQSGLAVGATSWVQLQSAPLHSVEIGDTMSVQLRLPTATGGWGGSVQLSVDSPARGVYGQYVGQKELAGLPRGAFSKLELTLPSDLKAKLLAGRGDIVVRVTLSTPPLAEAYVFDQVVFKAAPPSPPDSGSCQSCSVDNDCMQRHERCNEGMCRPDPYFSWCESDDVSVNRGGQRWDCGSYKCNRETGKCRKDCQGDSTQCDTDFYCNTQNKRCESVGGTLGEYGSQLDYTDRTFESLREGCTGRCAQHSDCVGHEICFGLQCKASVCSGSFEVTIDNGAIATKDCGAFECDPMTGRCRTLCGNSLDCTGEAVCNPSNSKCVVPN